MNRQPVASDRVEFVTAALLGTAVATSLMIAGFLLAGPRQEPDVVARLTAMGRDWFRPESDIKVYIAGCALAVVMTFLLTTGPSRRSHRVAAPNPRPDGRAGRLVLLTGAVLGGGLVGLTLFLPHLRSGFPSYPRLGLATMIASAVGGAVLGYLESLPGDRMLGRLGRSLDVFLEGRLSSDAPSARGSRSAGIVFGLSVLVLVGSIFVPRGDQLAGRFVESDMVPFHHWDYFAMGPALGFEAGGALGTEVYAQYGVLWPMLLAGAMRLYPFGYGMAVSLGSVYVCVFYVGLLFLLRSVTKSLVWAGTGTIVALSFQAFTGVSPTATIWLTPSCTVLRAPMVIWAFYALWKHATTGKLSWMIGAGVAAGLEILFELDTGIYLLASLLVYALWFLVCGPNPHVRSRAGFLGCGLLAMVVTLLAGLMVASRGTMTQPGFWRGWSEGLRSYAGGMSAIPIASIDQIGPLCLFAGITAGYLLAVALLLHQIYHRTAGPKLAVAGTLGVYGLTSMLLFVNRSHPWNIFHPCIPIVALATCVLAAGWKALPDRISQPSAAVGWIAAIAVLIMNPNYQVYPNVLVSVFASKTSPGLTLMPGVTGLPASVAPFVSEFADVTRKINELHEQGHSVGVLDPSDTIYHLATKVPPGDRYSPLLACSIWKDEVTQRVGRLRTSGQDWIAMRSPPDRRKFFVVPDLHIEDTLDELKIVLEQKYEPMAHIGTFDFWRRKSPSPKVPALGIE